MNMPSLWILFLMASTVPGVNAGRSFGPRTPIKSLHTILQLKSGSLEFDHNLEYTSNVATYSDEDEDSSSDYEFIGQSWNEQILQIRHSIMDSREELEAAIDHIQNRSALAAEERETQEEESKQIFSKQNIEPALLLSPSTTTSTSPERDQSNNFQFHWAKSQLAGWDTCAVFSAMTTMMSIYFGDRRERLTSLGLSFASRAEILFANVLVEALNYTGVATGLHGTIIFALLSVYGRRSLGYVLQQPNTQHFDAFLKSTSKYQQQGYRGFRLSIFLMGMQTILFLASQVGSQLLQWGGLVIMVLGFWKLQRDLQSSLDAAPY